jgi:hypothetical protein
MKRPFSCFRVFLLVALTIALGLSSSLCFAEPASPARGSAAAAPATPARKASAEVNWLQDSLTGPAKAEYTAARGLYESGDYDGALTKLQKAHALTQEPRLLWNMAACTMSLGRYAQTIAHVERYLEEGGASLTAKDRASARALVESVRGFVAELAVDVDQPAAQIYLDDRQVGTSPLAEALRVDAGKRALSVRKPGFVEFATTLEIEGGTPARIQVSLVASAHEGTLRIVAGAKDAISVDGRTVGTGLWTGKLPSGTHTVEVTASGKRPHQTEVVVRDDDLTTLNVALQDLPKSSAVAESGTPVWLWIAGGVLAVGAGVGAYALLSSGGDETSYTRPTPGTWGTVELP